MANKASRDALDYELLAADTEVYGKRIQERRKALGYSQDVVAAQLHITKQGLCRIEKGNAKNINRLYFEQLCKFLECHKDYLLGKSDDIHKTEDDLILPITNDPHWKFKQKIIDKHILDMELYELLVDAAEKTNGHAKSRQLLVGLLKNFMEFFS